MLYDNFCTLLQFFIVLDYMVLSMIQYKFMALRKKKTNHCSIIQSCTCFGDVHRGSGNRFSPRESNSCLKRSLLEYHLAYGYELIEIKLK